ncbi:MAG: alpha/beta hydrolase [Parvibaculum sp.]
MDTSFSRGDEKPVVMLIHGMWSRPAVWTHFRGYLEARGYRVLTPALRHHEHDGVHPELGTTSLADYVADLAGEIARLGRKPFIVGHSMGGLLAQMLAARGLATAIVGLAPAQSAGIINIDMRTVWVFRREFTSMGFWRRPQLPSFDAMRYGALNGLDDDDKEQLYSTLIPESGRALFEIGWWFCDRRRTTWLNPANIDCPVLFLTGTDDRLTPFWLTQRAAEAYDGRARLEALPGHAHWLPSEPGWERIAERTVHFFERDARAMGRAAEPAALGELVAIR